MRLLYKNTFIKHINFIYFFQKETGGVMGN